LGQIEENLLGKVSTVLLVDTYMREYLSNALSGKWGSLPSSVNIDDICQNITRFIFSKLPEDTDRVIKDYMASTVKSAMYNQHIVEACNELLASIRQ
jgi:hypothetical protein